ncbi:metallophosphoesterase family protein [candidate division CSSED10-310 bacterium]|uniref:Metallophosphoesterase family protein n=1 Tax=candidate division CSSED10-310 bacterium TaxID=2855610 RepID=A0ABV6YSN4_UNCC1
MRIAIISDVHANLEALEACLDRLEKEKIDFFVSLGDIVGYGADPNRCTEIIKDKCKISLVGNHDYAALGHLDISYFNPYAKKSVLWTGTNLTEENREYLESLEMYTVEKEIRYIHSTPLRPEDWNYIFTVHDARVNFSHFSEKLCFIGHSHQPVFILMNSKEEIFVHNSQTLTVDEDYRYIINVGSVGQPRDGNPESSFVIYDVDAGSIELVRVPYNIALTQTKMNKAQIHPFLVERLAYGR